MYDQRSVAYTNKNILFVSHVVYQSRTIRIIHEYTERYGGYNKLYPATWEQITSYLKSRPAVKAVVLLLRFVAGNVDVNTLASKRSELLGNADILRMRRVIHNDSTCVCLRIPVAAITQKRKNASVDMWPA